MRKVSVKATDLMAMMGVEVINVEADGSWAHHEISENPFTVTEVDEDN